MSAIPAPIAIVGVGCRLPGGASNLDRLWKLLSEGRSGHIKIPTDRWAAEEWFDAYPDAKQSIVTKHGFFLQEDISQFDAKFFGINPTEAHAMDPQQRLFLMTTYEALEDASIPIETLRGSNTGVFASIFERSYDRMGHKDLSTISNTHMNGTGDAILSNRISYCFDLKGPCMTIDTGCSGSLVALHQACQSLRVGESDLALVGGSQLVLHPDTLNIMSGMGMLNPDGKSYAFDSRGEGYGRGEGVATIVLKKLDRALEDGDRIHAVIANSGINQDGKTVGLNTPSGDAQAALSSRVYREAGLSPADTTFVEAHGTGTQVGDREEMSSVYKVFCESVGRTDDLYVGSIKPNVGHLEASSGIAGLLKSILVLKHGYIPPNLDFIKPKPSLKLYERNIKIPTELTKLPVPQNGGPTRVSLNSFGYGGTNCHVILEAVDPGKKKDGANGIVSNGIGSNGVKSNGIGLNGLGSNSIKPNGIKSNGIKSNGVESRDIEPNGIGFNGIKSNGVKSNGVKPNGIQSPENIQGERTASDLLGTNLYFPLRSTPSPELVVLSASTEKALLSRAEDLSSWIKTHDSSLYTLHSLAYTLGAQRSALPYRRTIVTSTIEALAAELKLPGPQKRSVSLAPVTFVFSGQGAQWHAMGLELMETSPVFRQSMLAMEDQLRHQGCEWSLTQELSKSPKHSRIGEAEIAQPATTAIQIALVDLLESFSIRPSRVVGHSSGEIAAAYAAGALSRENAIRIAYQRGVSSAQAKKIAVVPGSMMAVSLDEAEATRYLKKLNRGSAVVACVNSPLSQTLSGDETAIDEIKEVLDRDGIFARKLKVDTAYHSHHMQRVAEHYQAAIANVDSSEVRNGVTFYSSVTGSVKSTGFDSDYWTTNLVSQVKFSQALTLLQRDQITHDANMDVSLFVEIGPHSALAGPSRQTLAQSGSKQFKYEYLSALVRNTDALQSTLTLVGKMFEIGVQIDVKAILTMADKTRPEIIRDLKLYPWDLAPFWRESRLSKAHRFRRFPQHDLLGLFDPASTIQEPRWRYFVNLDSLPWLRGHMVEGFTIYPGAGYLAMAIEATVQLTQMRGLQDPISKFILRNVVISKSIILNEPDSGSSGEVEVQLSMSEGGQQEGSRWELFRIRSYNADDGSWSDHCSGEIKVEHETSELDEVEGSREEHLRQEEAKQFLETSLQSCDAEMTKSEFYDFSRVSGNEWSGAFTPINSAKYGKDRGVFEIANPDIAPLMPYRSFRPHVIHPITLDATQQMSALLFKKLVTNAACVPTKISLLEISANLSTVAGDILTGTMHIEADGPKASRGEGWVFQKNADGCLSPVIRLVADLRAIGETREEGNQPFAQDVVNRLDWNLDVDFMSRDSFLQMLSSTLGFDENTTHGFDGNKISIEESDKEFLLTDQASSIWFRNAVRYVEEVNPGTTTLQQLPFLGWMKRWLSSEYCKQIMSGLTAEDEESIVERVASSTTSAQLQLTARVGNALPRILTGETPALDVMLEGNLLSRYYESGILVGPYEAAVAYLKVLTFKNPRLRILEYGAGTGGCTKWLTRGLSGQNGAVGLPVEQYTFTDVSSYFFEEARQRFAAWEDVMEFRILDADADPIEQGFEPGSYDVVVGANVLHATRNIDVTMSRVRKLLKPGGSLVLLDIEPRGAAVGLIGGGLTGWWAPEEDFRIDGPLLFRNQWDEVLSRTGYGGIHLNWECLMVARAEPTPESSNGTSARNSVVLVNDAVDEHVANLAVEFTSRDIDVVECPWDQIKAQEDSLYVIIDHAEKNLLFDPQPQLLETVNALLIAKCPVLWVLVQDTANAASSAYKGLVNAFIRVIKRENSTASVVTLDIREPALQSETTARVVADVALRRFWPRAGDSPSLEPEFAYEKNQILIPRVKPDADFLQWARRRTGFGAADETETAPYQGDRPLKAEVATPGLLNTLRFVENEIPAAPAPSQITVKAEAHGLSHKDLSLILGQIGTDARFTGEFAGVVTAVGEDMRGLYQVGDRVMGLGSQPFSNLLHVHGYMAHRTPSWMSATVAASIPHAYVTAYHSLITVGRLERGHSVLIQDASAPVGQAAIQLAQHIGAAIFCTVGTAEERRLLLEEYGITEGHIFSSQKGTLERGIMRHTNSQGVDLVLSLSTGEALRDGLDCVKLLGTFVMLGGSETQQGVQLSMTALHKSVTFHAFDLDTLSARDPGRIHRMLGDIRSLLESKALRPISPITIYPIDDIAGSFRYLGSEKRTGKVVLEVQADSKIQCLPAKPPLLRMRRDATYVAAGGLGDLTWRVCLFLASRGAGHVVCLSRRVIDDATKEKFAAAVREHGCELHVLQCDITNEESVRCVAAYCSKLPPVRGVINGAMVLRDRTFAQMTVEQWKLPLQGKVFGTLNLDKVFASPDLAFFLTLSSIVVVVGRAGQSNYAAGNGFQDAFARAHAGHPNTHYISVNVGAVSLDVHSDAKGEISVGSMKATLRQNSVMEISFDEFFANIEYAMTDLARAHHTHQTIQGVTYQSMLDANDEHLLENPIFSQLALSQRKHAGDATEANKFDLKKALNGAKTMEEAEQLIRDATLTKFAVFLDRPIDSIRVDQSLANIGLDSLVSIELKNWMVRTFQVKLQTSELGGSGSIMALAATVASRSKLIPDGIRQSQPQDAVARVEDTSVSMNSHSKPKHDFYCCRACEELPRHPLVDLDEAVDDLLNSIGHFAHTRDEYTELRRKAYALAAPGSLSRRLYSQLRAKADDPSVESWIAEHLLKAMYLKRRYPIVPFSSFLTTNFDSTAPHSQAQRAATLTRALCEFKYDLDHNKLKPDFLGERPNCGYSLPWLFNSLREPNVGCDKIERYPGREYVAVLRRGHLFRLSLLDGDDMVSYSKLKATYQAILDLSLEEKHWTGILTTDNRDSWAVNRQKLLSLHPRNATYIQTLEESVYVMCLDDAAPVTREQRVRTGYLGDSFNRWHDKTLQVIVTSNGGSGTIFEHTMIDKMTTSQILQRMQGSINALDPENDGAVEAIIDAASLEEIPLVATTDEIEAHITLLREKYLSITDPKIYTPHIVPSLGSAELLSYGVPIKATVDLTIQLASRIYFGYLPASWETVSTAHFHKGRPEIVQVVLKSVVDFCDAALDESGVPRAEAREKLLRAGRETNAQIVKGGEGRNYFRLMDVLEVMSHDAHDEGAADAEAVPELFSDPVWKRSYPRLIMQTMLEEKIAQDAGYTMEDPENVWITYTVTDDALELSYVSPKTGTERFKAALDRAASIVKTIIQASGA